MRQVHWAWSSRTGARWPGARGAAGPAVGPGAPSRWRWSGDRADSAALALRRRPLLLAGPPARAGRGGRGHASCGSNPAAGTARPARRRAGRPDPPPAGGGPRPGAERPARGPGSARSTGGGGDPQTAGRRARSSDGRPGHRDGGADRGVLVVAASARPRCRVGGVPADALQLALADDPSVRINGFPFLPRRPAAATGSVDVEAERLTLGPLRRADGAGQRGS